MAADSKWYLVCYDVRSEGRLRRAAKTLEGYGQRVQFSVFRCYLTKAQMRQLQWKLTELLKAEDDVLFIPICSRCVQGIRVTHSTENRADWPDVPPGHQIV